MDIAIGSNLLRNTNGIFVANDHQLLQLEIHDGQPRLNMDLYNPTGTQVAKLENNSWKANDQNRFELQTEPRSLMVLDKTLKGVVIRLACEEDNRVTISQAKFYLPNGTLSQVTAESWQVGNQLELKGANVDLQGGAIEIQ